MANVGSSPGTGAGDQLLDIAIVSGKPMSCRVVVCPIEQYVLIVAGRLIVPHIILRLRTPVHAILETCKLHGLILMR